MDYTDNGTICSAFWKHTNIRGGNRIFPCCRFKEPVLEFDGNVSAILNSQTYDQLRLDSIAGTKNKNCAKCYLEESLGKKSLRQEFNADYATDTVELKYLEIGFDNICNLTCDGCWGEWSSSWANKENPNVSVKMNILDTAEITEIPRSIEKIVFLGGEPLMTNRHITFLKKISNLPATSVTYYTNGTFLLKEKDIEILKQAKQINFILSIDGVGHLNDKVRTGSNWSDILLFIDQISALGFNLSIHSVLHINNWHGFPELRTFVDSKNLQWTIGVLTYPNNLSIINLLAEEKVQLKNILERYNIPNRIFVSEYLDNDKTKNNANRKIYKLAQI